MADDELITAARARELFDYNPENGELRWKVSDRGRTGCIAGWVWRNNRGKTTSYRYVEVGNKGYPAHRLIWLMMTGEWPDPLIDHINRDGLDNRWTNLRVATAAINASNRGLRSDNKSGMPSVSWNRSRRMWHVNVHVGYFSSKEAANDAATATRRFVTSLRMGS
jgi:hypothetical protein